jgi:predicted acyltransferase (DUF342 family)
MINHVRKEHKMSRLILVAAMVATLAACSSAPVSQQEQSAKLVEKTVPDWFLAASSTPTAYKSAGDGVSGSISGALGNARANAFEGICQAAGGVVRSQTKVFRQDTESKSSSVSTTAIRNFCPDVDVSGASVEKQLIVRDGERFRAFVLVSLDKGAASDKAVKTTAAQEFKELDQLNADHQAQKR